MAQLAVVLATYNEEKNLPGCLDSVKEIADEIVIVDGTSTDKTVAIAKEYDAKVLVTTNPPIFHINKQKAIDMATKDWILQLDADERVTPELATEITSRINENPKENGFWVPRKNWFLGRYLMKGGQYPDYTMRLYRRGKGKLPQKDVHEQAVVEGSVGYLIHPLIHLADPSFRRYLMRFDRYTDLLAKELREKKHHSVFDGVKQLVILPMWWFLLTYGRHKGFMDGWQGFVFSLFSALRFPVSYIKYIRNK
jgi:glycosyltransferase involved in cell wall biosynthesis